MSLSLQSIKNELSNEICAVRDEICSAFSSKENETNEPDLWSKLQNINVVDLRYNPNARQVLGVTLVAAGISLTVTNIMSLGVLKTILASIFCFEGLNQSFHGNPKLGIGMLTYGTLTALCVLPPQEILQLLAGTACLKAGDELLTEKQML